MTDWWNADERRRLAIICENIRRGLCGCGRAPLPRTLKWAQPICDVCLAKKREANTQTKRELHRQGICSMCETRPARPGRWHCEECAAEQRERDRLRPVRQRGKRTPEYHRRYARAKAEGKCVRCRCRPARTGETLCEHCKGKRKRKQQQRPKGLAAQESKARREKAKAAGVCVRCMRSPAKPGQVQCEPCLEHKRQRRREAALNREGRRL